MEMSDSVLITYDLRPAYYDEFHCLMGDCRMNCCACSWRIEFDRKDYLKIRKQKGSTDLNRRLEHSMRRVRGDAEHPERYAEFVMDKGVCPLLSEDRLCRLQREKGEDVLPRICKEFPRLETVRIFGYLDRSLSPACEGVLALLWEHSEGVEFRVDPLPKEGWAEKTSFEENAMTKSFQEIRSLCIDFLQDRRRPLPHRILLMGLALQSLTEEEPDVPLFLENGRYLLAQGNAGELLGELNEERVVKLALYNNARTLMGLWSVGEEKRKFRNCMVEWLSLETQNGQVRLDLAAYLSARERFRERFSDRAYFMENLMVSLFFHLGLPDVNNPEEVWKSYVNFCNVYALYQFAAVMSCREGAPEGREELFRLMVVVGRTLIHTQSGQQYFRDEFFQNDSATLAHMAVLLCGT